MAVRSKEVRSIKVLGLSGSFFGDKETDELEKALMDLDTAGNKRLVIDMKDCSALNSTAIGVLARAHAKYKSRGGEIKLCGLGKRVKDIFVMTKLIMLFDHHDTEEQAIAAFAE